MFPKCSQITANFVSVNNNHLKELGKVLMFNEFDQNAIHFLINKNIASTLYLQKSHTWVAYGRLVLEH
jgi:hypothetical protein